MSCKTYQNLILKVRGSMQIFGKRLVGVNNLFRLSKMTGNKLNIYMWLLDKNENGVFNSHCIQQWLVAGWRFAHPGEVVLLKS